MARIKALQREEKSHSSEKAEFSRVTKLYIVLGMSKKKWELTWHKLRKKNKLKDGKSVKGSKHRLVDK